MLTYLKFMVLSNFFCSNTFIDTVTEGQIIMATRSQWPRMNNKNKNNNNNNNNNNNKIIWVTSLGITHSRARTYWTYKFIADSADYV
jgi:uncharacterized protein YjfI (DUF2170 family)